MDFTDADIPSLQDELDDECDLPLAHRAAANGELNTLKRAIQVDPTVLEHQDTEGMTPLGHAVMTEQQEAVKLLVKMGAFINTTDYLGRTCLSLAAYQGWYDGVKFLLRNGASQSLCDKSGRSALHSATYSTDTQVWKLLLQNVSTAGLNQSDIEGMTPLHWTAFHNRPAHTKIILERGANIRAQDVDGKTALHWAAQNGCEDCCGVLLQAPSGTKLLNETDYSGKMPIHFAAAAGHAGVLRAFADTGQCLLEVDDPDERHKSEDEVELCLNQEDNMAYEDERLLQPRTPLHWAAAMGKAEAVSALLELNVDPKPEDVEGKTPLDYAKISGHRECVDILEERLGVRKPTENNSQTQGQKVPETKKKNRLGFFTDLFRPKRVGKDGQDPAVDAQDKSKAQGGSKRRDSTSDVAIGFTATTQGEKQDLALSGLNNNKQGDVEVVNSIKKLQFSRQDNPSLNDDQVPISKKGSNGRPSTINTAGLLQKQPGLDHSRLIRSPPPMLPRDHHLTSGPVLRSEANRAQLEEDAAQILALHHPSTSRSMTSSRSLTPRSLTPLSSRTTSETTFSDETEGRHLSQLAPIRGPLPKMGSNFPVNERLETLRQEKSGLNRSPTPPGWAEPKHNGIPPAGDPDDFGDSSPSMPHRKKKKKKSSSLLPSTMEHQRGHTTGPGHNSSKDHNALCDSSEEGRQGNRDLNSFEERQHLTPRLNDKQKVSSDRMRLNKNMNSLLH